MDVWNETDITATTNMWSSNMGDRHCTMSIHYIMQDWKLPTKILWTQAMKEPHTNENINRKMLMLRMKLECDLGLMIAK